MKQSHDREIIGGHLLVIGGAEDKYNERRILKKFLTLAGGEKAEVLIVPVASDYPEFAADVYSQAFQELGRDESASAACDVAARRFSGRSGGIARWRNRRFYQRRRPNATRVVVGRNEIRRKAA